MRQVLLLSTALLAGVVLATPRDARASLTSFQQYNGTYAVSTAGFGSLGSSGTITANVPVGSTIVGAFLYSSTIPGITSATGTFGGSAVTYSALGANPYGLDAYRANVTSTVAAAINGGPGGAYSFAITEGNTAQQDGEALVVVYSNPTLPIATVGILDGNSNASGDTTSINFATPLDPTASGFFAELRLGDGYSCCGQASNITVNGTLITQNAGNNDESGIDTNGALFTVGGDTDPFSPLLPTYAQDHERYNIVPQIKTGDTTIKIDTLNPSGDDNIFLAVVYTSGIGGVNVPPPVTGVPEPASFALLGVGVLGLGLIRRARRPVVSTSIA